MGLIWSQCRTIQTVIRNLIIKIIAKIISILSTRGMRITEDMGITENMEDMAIMFNRGLSSCMVSGEHTTRRCLRI